MRDMWFITVQVGTNKTNFNDVKQVLIYNNAKTKIVCSNVHVEISWGNCCILLIKVDTLILHGHTDFPCSIHLILISSCVWGM